jgi:hypothetical protein
MTTTTTTAFPEDPRPDEDLLGDGGAGGGAPGPDGWEFLLRRPPKGPDPLVLLKAWRARAYRALDEIDLAIIEAAVWKDKIVTRLGDMRGVLIRLSEVPARVSDQKMHLPDWTGPVSMLAHAFVDAPVEYVTFEHYGAKTGVAIILAFVFMIGKLWSAHMAGKVARSQVPNRRTTATVAVFGLSIVAEIVFGAVVRANVDWVQSIGLAAASMGVSFGVAISTYGTTDPLKAQNEERDSLEQDLRAQLQAGKAHLIAFKQEPFKAGSMCRLRSSEVRDEFHEILGPTPNPEVQEHAEKLDAWTLLEKFKARELKLEADPKMERVIQRFLAAETIDDLDLDEAE